MNIGFLILLFLFTTILSLFGYTEYIWKKDFLFVKYQEGMTIDLVVDLMIIGIVLYLFYTVFTLLMERKEKKRIHTIVSALHFEDKEGLQVLLNYTSPYTLKKITNSIQEEILKELKSIEGFNPLVNEQKMTKKLKKVVQPLKNDLYLIGNLNPYNKSNFSQNDIYTFIQLYKKYKSNK